MKIKTPYLLLLLPFLPFTSTAQFTGNMDDLFGESGHYWYNWTGDGTASEPTDLIIDQASGSFYIPGSLYLGDRDAMLIRANLDGTPDDDLEESTIRYDSFGSTDDRFNAVAIQPNGKMVAGGYYQQGPALGFQCMMARFNTDGSFDPTFNGGSPLSFGGPFSDVVSVIKIQPDGKIIAAGLTDATWTNFNLFVIRLNSDGSPDGTFGTSGSVTIDSEDGFEVINDLIILDNGHLLAVGQSETDNFAFMLDEDGNFDSEFSSDGQLRFKVNSLSSGFQKAAELEDGHLMVAGNTYDAETDGYSGFILKMEPSGNLVTDFNGLEGTQLLNPETEAGTDSTFTVRDMEVLTTGQYLVAADFFTDSGDTETKQLALVLVNPDGSIDPSFGENGYRFYDLSEEGLPNTFARLAQTEAGAIYLSGKVIESLDDLDLEDIVVIRLFGDIADLASDETPTLSPFIYPNPSAGPLNLRFNNPTAGPLTITIYDATGKLNQSLSLDWQPTGLHEINLSNQTRILSPGTYLIQLITNAGTATCNFVKQ